MLIIRMLIMCSSICYANQLVYDANNQFLGELMDIENDNNIQVLKDNYLIEIVVDQYADHQYATVKHLYEFLYLSEDCTGQTYIRYYHFLPKLFFNPTEIIFMPLIIQGIALISQNLTLIHLIMNVANRTQC